MAKRASQLVRRWEASMRVSLRNAGDAEVLRYPALSE
jgi:hypothetical protein